MSTIRRIGGLKGIYQSKYPPAFNSTYVKATSIRAGYNAEYVCDPSKSLIGNSGLGNEWCTNLYVITNQRFHIDLGVPTVINRIYYENFHHSGESTVVGAKNFTFQGSNGAAAFAELTYATNTNWTDITTSPTVFDQHSAANSPDPKYITVINSLPYRYYAIKIADNYGDAGYLAIRRIELQVMV